MSKKCRTARSTAAWVEKSADDRDAIWNMLREETMAIAKEMEHKYHIKLKLPD